MDFAEHYRKNIAEGALRPDPGQGRMVAALAELAADLPRLTRRAFWPWEKNRTANGEKRGLYLYGPVGRGKTMVMDLFYEAITGVPKLRVHFHAFMLDIHRRLHEARDHDDALAEVAGDVARQARLLCFDEFQVSNIVDAMILSRLLTEMFNRGVVLVATSNTPPDDLYRGGLQRSLFLPCIALIRQRLKIVNAEAGTDYRQSRLQGMPVYFHPLGAVAHRGLSHVFRELTDAAEGEPMEIELDGRVLEVPRAAHGVVWFDFDALCRRPVGTAEYLALSDHFHTVIMENVPHFIDARRDEATRFIHLVDCFYDRHTRLVISAESPPDELMEPGHALEAIFARTRSRLSEMQSEDYLLADVKRPEKTAQKA
jgi:cell division protein ZapE